MERTPTLEAESCSSQEEWDKLKAEENENARQFAYVPSSDLVSNPF